MRFSSNHWRCPHIKNYLFCFLFDKESSHFCSIILLWVYFVNKHGKMLENKLSMATGLGVWINALLAFWLGLYLSWAWQKTEKISSFDYSSEQLSNPEIKKYSEFVLHWHDQTNSEEKSVTVFAFLGLP